MNRYAKVDLHDAQWISTGGKCSTPLIRSILHLSEISRATITIAGLGIYELYINGQKELVFSNGKIYL